MIGLVVSTRMLLFGKVTGASGTLKGASALSSSFSPYRTNQFCLVGGLLFGGWLSSKYVDGSFEDVSNFPIGRLILAGLCVGVGTTLGNGCTSGHAICGIAQFRIRSVVATCMFMGTGFATAIFSNTSALLPSFTGPKDLTQSIQLALPVTGVLVANAVISTIIPKKMVPLSALRVHALITELLCGTAFGVAMGVSGMSKMSATISFLDLRTFNPALMFVMGGAIPLSAVLFSAAKSTFSEPVLGDGEGYFCPASSAITWQLVVGEALFGIGWGLAGSCPAPAMVNLGNGITNGVGSGVNGMNPWLYVGAVVTGMWACSALMDSGMKSPTAKKGGKGS